STSTARQAQSYPSVSTYFGSSLAPSLFSHPHLSASVLHPYAQSDRESKTRSYRVRRASKQASKLNNRQAQHLDESAATTTAATSSVSSSCSLQPQTPPLSPHTLSGLNFHKTRGLLCKIASDDGRRKPNSLYY
uniref:Uncharacterized protein n=1 Tax=Aegilops tauschii subsp. strangulata TaxID=200361 RepID=A0A453SVE0_AEGTS